MSKFKVITTPIKGLLIIEPTVHSDKHGFFMNTDSKQDLLEIGVDVEFIQESTLKMARGVLKGLHFQREHTQGRLVSVASGAVLDVAVDLRPDSKTYGASWSEEISAENQRMLWIPEQFAHGFLSLEASTEIIIKSTDHDDSKSLTGIVWNDHIISINWQFERYDIDEKYLNVSDRDKNLPIFRSWNPKTLWNSEIDI